MGTRAHRHNTMRPIRVMFIIDDLGLGGAQRQLVELVRAMPRERFDLRVAALSIRRVDYVEPLRRVGVEPVLISQTGKWSWSAFVRLWRLIRRSRPDVVQTCLFTADLYGRLAARFARVPVVVSSVRSIEPDKPRHYVWVDRWLRRWTDAFIVNAQAVGETLSRREGVPPERIRTIYNGVDVEMFVRLPVSPLARSSPSLVGIVGRLAPVKDHETFIRAAAQVVGRRLQARFLIVGDGPRRDALKRLARAEGLDGELSFIGSRRDTAELFKTLDLVVVSSLYEGCCNVILEAMAAGRPVVATAVGGNPELVVPGETGYLVPPQDPAALAEAIGKILSDSTLARWMGVNGRLRAQRHFALERMVQETCALFEELLGRRHGSRVTGRG